MIRMLKFGVSYECTLIILSSHHPYAHYKDILFMDLWEIISPALLKTSKKH